MAERDPIKLLGDWLIGEKLADASRKLDEIQAQVKSEMEAAVEFAYASSLSRRG